MVSEMVSPPNAVRPASISNSTHPNDQMSLRLSRPFPRACSGLMYAGVPRIARSPRCDTVTVGAPDVQRAWRAVPDFCQPEIEHFDGAVGGDLDIGWLEIAMNDAFVVCRFQRGGDLAGDG